MSDRKKQTARTLDGDELLFLLHFLPHQNNVNIITKMASIDLGQEQHRN